MRKPVLGVLGVGFLGVVVTSCALPNTDDIHLSECIKGCNEENTTCLDGVGDKACFETLETCFDAASECHKSCPDCETEDTCLDEKACFDTCTDQTNNCTDMIDFCVDRIVDEATTNLKGSCLNPLVDCVAVCIEEVEDLF